VKRIPGSVKCCGPTIEQLLEAVSVRRSTARRALMPQATASELLQQEGRSGSNAIGGNSSSMLGCRERDWRVLWTESSVPGLAGTTSTSTGLCLLKAMACVKVPAAWRRWLRSAARHNRSITSREIGGRHLPRNRTILASLLAFTTNMRPKHASATRGPD
jgi:hypothetical protein